MSAADEPRPCAALRGRRQRPPASGWTDGGAGRGVTASVFTLATMAVPDRAAPSSSGATIRTGRTTAPRSRRRWEATTAQRTIEVARRVHFDRTGAAPEGLLAGRSELSLSRSDAADFSARGVHEVMTPRSSARCRAAMALSYSWLVARWLGREASRAVATCGQPACALRAWGRGRLDRGAAAMRSASRATRVAWAQL